MPATLPDVRGSAVALYPVSRSDQIAVSVARFLNATEQRFKRTAPLGTFELKYTGLDATDRDTLKAFVASTKGAFDTTWQWTLTSLFTTNTFIDDAFTSVEGALPNRYDVTLRFRQAQKGGWPIGAGSTFPVLSTGASVQRPFTQTVNYRTSKNDNPTGMRYSYSWYGSALTGFPTRGLLSWKLQYPAINDADMVALEAFFVAMNGAWQTFSFTDPDSGTTYPKVRFDMPAFQYTYLANNLASTTILLAETN